MYKHGLFPCGMSHACRLLSRDAHADETGFRKRLEVAPKGAYLAVDILVSKHKGWKIQGLGQYYDTSEKGVVWSLGFAEGTLIWTNREKDPYPLCVKGYLYKSMASREYPSLKPSELMVSLARKSYKALNIKAVTFDAGITARPALSKLKTQGIAFIGRIGVNNNIIYQGKEIGIKKFVQEFTLRKVHWYKKLGCYAKRLEVYLPSVGKIDLVIMWWWKKEGYTLSALASTLKAGLQEVIKVHKARWRQEVYHRLLKQNFGFESCQCQGYAAQLKHADLCIDAFHQVRAKKQDYPELTWREAQKLFVK